MSQYAKYSEVRDIVAQLFPTYTGRRDVNTRYHVPVWLTDVLSRELADYGMATINKAGAVTPTLKGKNARQALNSSDSFWHAWGDSWRMSEVDYKYRPSLA